MNLRNGSIVGARQSCKKNPFLQLRNPNTTIVPEYLMKAIFDSYIIPPNNGLSLPQLCIYFRTFFESIENTPNFVCLNKTPTIMGYATAGQCFNDLQLEPTSIVTWNSLMLWSHEEISEDHCILNND